MVFYIKRYQGKSFSSTKVLSLYVLYRDDVYYSKENQLKKSAITILGSIHIILTIILIDYKKGKKKKIEIILVSL